MRFDVIGGLAGPVVAAVLSVHGAAAQNTTTGVPSALQGFSINRDKAVQIEAGALEVRDKDKIAKFTGDVRLVQGDTVLGCKTLLVYYEGDDGDITSALQSGVKREEQRIRKVVAQGGVKVTQGDQSASGDSGVFDMRTNTVTLTGNVVVARGSDVLRGHKLTVDIANGVSTIESGNGPVEGLFRASGAVTPPRAQTNPGPMQLPPPPMSLRAN
jgi:lipopolysaccharide export system protein LptA